MSNIIYFTPLKSVFLGKPYYTIMALGRGEYPKLSGLDMGVSG
jgi:hypothetical protein